MLPSSILLYLLTLLTLVSAPSTPSAIEHGIVDELDRLPDDFEGWEQMLRNFDQVVPSSSSHNPNPNDAHVPHESVIASPRFQGSENHPLPVYPNTFASSSAAGSANLQNEHEKETLQQAFERFEQSKVLMVPTNFVYQPNKEVRGYVRDWKTYLTPNARTSELVPIREAVLENFDNLASHLWNQHQNDVVKIRYQAKDYFLTHHPSLSWSRTSKSQRVIVWSFHPQNENTFVVNGVFPFSSEIWKKLQVAAHLPFPVSVYVPHSTIGNQAVFVEKDKVTHFAPNHVDSSRNVPILRVESQDFR